MSVEAEDTVTAAKRARTRWLILAALAVAAVAALALLLNPGGSPEEEASGPPAPDVTLPAAGSGEFTLADHRGQVVVLDFLAPG